MLALRPNQPVATEWLVEGLWGGAPPASALANVRSYVTAVRRLLEPERPGGPWIDRSGGRYVLRADAAGLDTLRFDRDATDGRRHLEAGRHALAAERLARACALWRGPVLEGTPIPPAVAATATALEERRLDALEDWVDARLATGRHTGLVTELHELTEAHPFRERLWGQRMLALYRCGRQAEALHAYLELRRLLVDELGIEPSPPTQELHQRLLRADPALLAPEGARPRPWHAPWQLPPGTPELVGRDAHLAAVTRVLDHYVRSTAGATGVLYPGLGAGGGGQPRAAARAWLDAETHNLLASAAHAAASGSAGHATALAAALSPDLTVRGRYLDNLSLNALALAAAGQLGDPGAEATARYHLGATCYRLDLYAEALTHLAEALRLWAASRNRAGEARARSLLGFVHAQLGRPREAAGHLRSALRARRQLGDRGGEGATLRNLGVLHHLSGRYAAAVAAYHQALRAHLEVGDRLGEGRVLGGLGVTHQRQGDSRLARRYLDRSLLISRELGHRAGESAALEGLGDHFARAGEPRRARELVEAALDGNRVVGDRAGEAGALNRLARLAGRNAAVDQHEEALAVAERIGSPRLRCEILNDLALALRSLGRPTAALAHHRSALALARATGDRYERARAHLGVADSLHGTGRTGEASKHREAARAVLAMLGVDGTTDARDATGHTRPE